MFHAQKINNTYKNKENKMLFAPIALVFLVRTRKLYVPHKTFLQTLVITQKFKMVDLDILQILKWQNMLHSLSEVLLRNNNYEIEGSGIQHECTYLHHILN